MDMRRHASMRLSDDEQYDWLKNRLQVGAGDVEPPEYPPGMCFMVSEANFEGLGMEGAAPDATVRFAAIARATSVNRSRIGCRIECEIDLLSLDGGKMVEMSEAARPAISLDENDHERLDLDSEGCERGDMLHLIGMVRVERTSDSEYGGKYVCFQIIEASVEDEDAEADSPAQRRYGTDE
jgi:hypothetical protein